MVPINYYMNYRCTNVCSEYRQQLQEKAIFLLKVSKKKKKKKTQRTTSFLLQASNHHDQHFRFGWKVGREGRKTNTGKREEEMFGKTTEGLVCTRSFKGKI